MLDSKPATVRAHDRAVLAVVADPWKIQAGLDLSKNNRGSALLILMPRRRFPFRRRSSVDDNSYQREDMSISVRDGTLNDAEPIARLCTQLGYPLESRIVPSRLARLESDPNARCLVAQSDADVAGLATVHLRHTLNHEAPIAQLTLLVVDEAQRTRGIGRVLVQAAEEWARSRGAKRFVVTTALQRADAHAFYEKLQFKHTGRRYGKDFS